ncbi:hypothetical protein [Sphingomonas sp. CFBP 8765]|nr:hypothetical protein [Sphingomonas sp. CFBP 8765]MBD8469440.1 hypothetical protein [Sphingomonas sp. CFBP 8765]
MADFSEFSPKAVIPLSTNSGRSAHAHPLPFNVFDLDPESSRWFNCP